MASITQSKPREIVEDFAKEIREKRLPTAKPSKTVINFRTDLHDGNERQIFQVPIGLLRYRKDNGRIASDVMDYEQNIGILHENDDEAQAIVAGFIDSKDPEKTAVLRQSIIHDGQREPAIITCDGFLVNGNRRKFVLEGLRKEFPQDDRYAFMKCVILPGQDDEGGPPTILDIEKIENRYQLQSDGKSEYYGFDRALSIKRKIDVGLSLEEQLRDDPQYAEARNKELQKAVRQYKKDYLAPLECIDRYLKQFRRDGQYRAISSGMTDREGRWQAFIDYSNSYSRAITNSKKQIELGIEEDEVGAIEEAAFDIIRLRTIPGMPKVHTIMRDLPKYCSTQDGKKDILKIADEVDPLLPTDECYDKEGKPLPPIEIDRKWAAKHKECITYHVARASKSHESQKERESALELLEAAYKKLTHDGLDLDTLPYSDYQKAKTLLKNIRERIDDLERDIYHKHKELKKLKQQE